MTAPTTRYPGFPDYAPEEGPMYPLAMDPNCRPVPGFDEPWATELGAHIQKAVDAEDALREVDPEDVDRLIELHLILTRAANGIGESRDKTRRAIETYMVRHDQHEIVTAAGWAKWLPGLATALIVPKETGK